MEILILLLLLSIKHWYADFAIQTYEQTVRKGIYGDLIGIRHSIDHVWTSMLVLSLYSLYVPVSLCIILLLPVLEGIVHYHIDWVKVRFGSKDFRTLQFWNQFGLDQLAHEITYLSMAWVILG